MAYDGRNDDVENRMGANKHDRRRLFAEAEALADTLKELGCEPIHVEVGDVVVSKGALRIRCQMETDEMFFGISSTFDRWANSRDYVFENMPYDAERLAVVLRIAEDKVAEGVDRGDDVEPVRLNTWWRQYRRRREEDPEDDAAQSASR